MIIRSLILGAALASLTFAGPLVSKAGLTLEYWDDATSSYKSDKTSVAITEHSLWQDATGGGIWISYEQTGIDRSGPAVTPSQTIARFKVYQPFTAGPGALLDLSIWADDTTGVYLIDSANNETELFAPRNTEITCSPNPIGCLPETGGFLNDLALAPGDYTLRFDVYQLGQSSDAAANPTGLLYTGSVSAVPEPGTWAMIAAGLTLVFGSRHGRK